ncbi:MAG: hypothetical protein O7H41_17055 [Planctomycetota bacterium]|nr:hypothetical protein [Planctomycetota bacterium]
MVGPIEVMSVFLLPGLLSFYQWQAESDFSLPLDDGEMAGKAGIDWPGIWIWSEAGRKRFPFARVRAFDIEASVYAFVYARAGFSPGEFVDFFLGWFGVDIARDDVAVETGEPPVEEK